MNAHPLAKIETIKIAFNVTRIREHDSSIYYRKEAFYPAFTRLKKRPCVLRPIDIKSYYIYNPKDSYVCYSLQTQKEIDSFYKYSINTLLTDTGEIEILRLVGIDEKGFHVYKQVETWKIEKQ